MKAMICTRYGTPNVLRLEEIEKPIPKDNDVLIRIHATSVTAADYRIRGLNVPFGFSIIMRLAMGLNKPRKAILGLNLAGDVEAIGKNVSLFKVGDQVFGTSGMQFGAYAEYICLAEESSLAIIPANVTYEEAAAFPFGALTALYFLRDKGNVQKGQKVLVYGASGAVGAAAVQLANYLGANVTGVCSTTNLEMVRALGAGSVIDYTKDDFSRSAEKYDIIFDTVGKSPFFDSLKLLNNNGRYLLAVADLPLHVLTLLTSLMSSKKVIAGVASEKKEDLSYLRELLAADVMKPVIDRCYPFEQIPAAHEYAEKGHKKGNVVINL